MFEGLSSLAAGYCPRPPTSSLPLSCRRWLLGSNWQQTQVPANNQPTAYQLPAACWVKHMSSRLQASALKPQLNMGFCIVHSVLSAEGTLNVVHVLVSTALAGIVQVRLIS